MAVFPPPHNRQNTLAPMALFKQVCAVRGCALERKPCLHNFLPAHAEERSAVQLIFLGCPLWQPINLIAKKKKIKQSNILSGQCKGAQEFLFLKALWWWISCSGTIINQCSANGQNKSFNSFLIFTYHLRWVGKMEQNWWKSTRVGKSLPHSIFRQQCVGFL